MTEPEPRPTREIDYELRHTIQRFHRLRWWSVAALSVVVVVALIVGGVIFQHQQRQLTASCALWRDLASLSVKPLPPVRTPSKVTITIVVDSRRAYIGECPGPVPPPDPSLVFWAHQYHIPIP